MYQAVQKVSKSDLRQLKLILTQKHNLTKKEFEMRLLNALSTPVINTPSAEKTLSNVIYLQDYVEQSL